MSPHSSPLADSEERQISLQVNSSRTVMHIENGTDVAHPQGAAEVESKGPQTLQRSKFSGNIFEMAAAMGESHPPSSTQVAADQCTNKVTRAHRPPPKDITNLQIPEGESFYGSTIEAKKGTTRKEQAHEAPNPPSEHIQRLWRTALDTECPICPKKKMKDHTGTPCGHSACRTCLKKQIKTAMEPARCFACRSEITEEDLFRITKDFSRRHRGDGRPEIKWKRWSDIPYEWDGDWSRIKRFVRSIGMRFAEQRWKYDEKCLREARGGNVIIDD